MTVFVVLAGVIVFGLALTLLGLHGRVAGDEPRCRRCGFDLRGNPAAEVCGECGAALTRPDATRTGRRVRRPRLLAGGLALLLPAVLLGGVIGYGTLRGVDWMRHAPEWWLLRDAESAGLSDTAALDELADRQYLGKLSPAAVARLVRLALDRQADPAATWKTTYGDVIETAWNDGDLDDKDKGDYLCNGLGVRLEARPDVRPGDALPLKVIYDFRVGRGGLGQMAAGELRLFLDGRPLDVPGVDRFASTPPIRYVAWTRTAANVPPALTRQWQIGDHALSVRLDLSVDPAGPRTIDGRYAAALSRTVELSVPVRVRPSDEPENLFATDPAVGEKLNALARVSAVAPPAAMFRSKRLWAASVALPPERAALAFDFGLFARTADGDFALNAASFGITFGAAGCGTLLEVKTYGTDPPPPEAVAAGRVTLVLKPDAAAARRRTDGRRPWGGELVFPNVPVSPDPPGGRTWYGTDGNPAR